MSEIQNAAPIPRAETSSPGERVPLERLLRRQRALAWSFSAGTLLLTASFFASMSLNASALAHVVWGRFVTVADLAAVVIILLFLLSVVAFGWQARRIDTELDRRERN